MRSVAMSVENTFLCRTGDFATGYLAKCDRSIRFAARYMLSMEFKNLMYHWPVNMYNSKLVMSYIGFHNTCLGASYT